ncbi:hypothetical protein [Ralstonia sp. SET104]|uniref:hypothetical protein n=1 Tax=Ralstonia sp. SET104 TaxID=2448774 RepID=UPI000F57F0D4|nr:hypothetical protein [Ralstonia sp. SET104]GCB03398.1 hypothetical protein PSUB009319_10290 [Ralstonia sp. SET104]
MDSLNFTIDGQLGIPGFVRVPPPFGTPRPAVWTLRAALARVQGDELPAMAETERRAARAQWRQCLTIVAVGMACTAAAALIGAYTGKRVQPALDIAPMQHAASTNPAPAGADPAKIEIEKAPEARSDIIATADDEQKIRIAPALMKSPDKPMKPRTLARTSGRTAMPAVPAQPATTIYDKPVPLDAYRAMTDTAPVASSYVAPGTSVHIEPLRHTRLTEEPTD